MGCRFGPAGIARTFYTAACAVDDNRIDWLVRQCARFISNGHFQIESAFRAVLRAKNWKCSVGEAIESFASRLGLISRRDDERSPRCEARAAAHILAVTAIAAIRRQLPRVGTFESACEAASVTTQVSARPSFCFHGNRSRPSQS